MTDFLVFVLLCASFTTSIVVICAVILSGRED